MKNQHFLLLTFAAQGHLNPTFQLAKRLLSYGARVTFVTSAQGSSKIKSLPSLSGLSFATFSDGFSDGTPPIDNPRERMANFNRVGYQSLTELVQNLCDEGNPVDFIVYGILLSFAADVASAFSIPSALFCSQCATVFVIYQHFFNSRDGLYNNNDGDVYNNIPPASINLPNLPTFEEKDLPSLLLPTNTYAAAMVLFQDHIKYLENDSNACMIINTFDSLERGIIAKNVDNIDVITVGPLIPLDDNSKGCDLFEASEGYAQWLDSKSDLSVVYVSFGSLAVLKRKQMEEVLHGLVNSGFSFLWVIRDCDEEFEEMIREVDKDGVGLIVKWCVQVEVLKHTSVGCFVSHCGWNSVLESLVGGVPVVGVPQFSDQMVNAKMVEEVWGNGVRGRVTLDGDDRVVEREEIRRCVELVMGSGGEEIRVKAKKWKELALEAVDQANKNVKVFLEKCGA